MIYEYFSNKNLFTKQKYASLKASNIEYLRTLGPHHEGARCVGKLVRVPETVVNAPARY